MKTPPELEAVAGEREEITITERDYGDEQVVADAAIVVADDQQFEFEVPASASEITVNDGILTIKE